jgi:hypothetical protein
MPRLAAAAAAVGLVVIAVVWLQGRRDSVTINRAPLATATLTLTLCVVVAAAGMFIVSRDQWQVANASAQNVGAFFGGEAPDGIDAAAGGRKTLIANNVPPFYALWVEFFNKDIERVIVRPTKAAGSSAGYGPTCPLTVRRDGSIVIRPACRIDSDTFVMAALPQVIPTLHGEQSFAGGFDPYALLHVVSGQPRLLASRSELCPPPQLACLSNPVLTWTDAPGVLELRFAGGAEPYQVEVAGKVRLLQPNAETVIRTPVARGASQTLIRPGWPAASPGVPSLTSIRLRPRGSAPVAIN